MEWILALVAGVIVGGVGFFWFSRKKNPVEDNSFLLIQQQFCILIRLILWTFSHLKNNQE